MRWSLEHAVRRRARRGRRPPVGQSELVAATSGDMSVVDTGPQAPTPGSAPGTRIETDGAFHVKRTRQRIASHIARCPSLARSPHALNRPRRRIRPQVVRVAGYASRLRASALRPSIVVRGARRSSSRHVPVELGASARRSISTTTGRTSTPSRRARSPGIRRPAMSEHGTTPEALLARRTGPVADRGQDCHGRGAPGCPPAAVPDAARARQRRRIPSEVHARRRTRAAARPEASPRPDCTAPLCAASPFTRHSAEATKPSASTRP